jgi:hypothetical protein
MMYIIKANGILTHARTEHHAIPCESRECVQPSLPMSPDSSPSLPTSPDSSPSLPTSPDSSPSLPTSPDSSPSLPTSPDSSCEHTRPSNSSCLSPSASPSLNSHHINSYASIECIEPPNRCESTDFFKLASHLRSTYKTVCNDDKTIDSEHIGMESLPIMHSNMVYIPLRRLKELEFIEKNIHNIVKTCSMLKMSREKVGLV